MTLQELLSVLNSYTKIIVVNWNNHILSVRDGKNTIDPKYNDSIVLEVSIYSTTTLQIMINAA